MLLRAKNLDDLDAELAAGEVTVVTDVCLLRQLARAARREERLVDLLRRCLAAMRLRQCPVTLVHVVEFELDGGPK